MSSSFREYAAELTLSVAESPKLDGQNSRSFLTNFVGGFLAIEKKIIKNP